MSHPYNAARLFDEPLLAHPDKARVIARAFGPRLIGGDIVLAGLEPSTDADRAETMGRLGDPLANYYDDRDALHRVGPVALIPVEGTLVHKGRWIGKSSGQTSYEGLFRQVRAARDDASVQGVVFEVDSYGGEVAGAFDIATEMHALSQVKPTIAILTDFAYSAGYLLASAARQIIIPETGGAGSIGVVTLHADFSAHLKDNGVVVTLLAAGKHKVDGNEFEPLADDVRTRIKGELESVRRLFAEAVGLHRGARLTTDAALRTEAQCYRGPEAVDIGLADAVARPSEAFEAFLAEITGRTPAT